jgi:hypothetical protein
VVFGTLVAVFFILLFGVSKAVIDGLQNPAAPAQTPEQQVLTCIDPVTGEQVACGDNQQPAAAYPVLPTQDGLPLPESTPSGEEGDEAVCFNPLTGELVDCGGGLAPAPEPDESEVPAAGTAFGCNTYACSAEDGIWLSYPEQVRDGKTENNSYNHRGRYFYYALGYQDAPGKAWPDVLEQRADAGGIFACVWLSWLGDEIESQDNPVEITVPWEIYRNCGGQ